MRDSLAQTPLHIVAMMGNEEETRRLASMRGTKVNAKDFNGFTPLAVAIHYGQLGCAKALLEHPRVDANPRDHTGRTLAHLAVERPSLAGLKLVMAKADPLQEEMSGSNAFGWAAFHGSFACVKHLCKTLDPKRADSQGMTPLMHAAMGGDVNVIRHLLPLSDLSARTSAGLSPLMFAAQMGRLKAVLELAAHFDPLEKDRDGKTALTHVSDTADMGAIDLRRVCETERYLRALTQARREMVAISRHVRAHAGSGLRAAAVRI